MDTGRRCLVLAVLFAVALLLGVRCDTAETGRGLQLAVRLENEGTLHLEPVDTVGRDPGPVIGKPQSFAVDNRGHLFVADAMRSFIWEFSPDGDSVDVIGRKGRGPGEFVRPSFVEVGPNDSLFVLDGTNRRVSVFALDSTRSFAYSFRLQPSRRRSPSAVYPTTSGKIIARYTRPRNPNLGTPGHWIVQVNRSGDIVRDRLLQLPLKETYIREPRPGHLRAVVPPFGRRTVFSYHPNVGLCHGWTDSLHVQCWTLDSPSMTRLDVEHKPLRVRDEEIRLRRQSLAPDQIALIDQHGWHSTHPAFRGMLVDHTGRFWIMEPEEPRDGRMPSYSWHLVDTDSQRFWSAHLPPRMRIRAATQNHAYATRLGGPPLLFVYRINR